MAEACPPRRTGYWAEQKLEGETPVAKSVTRKTKRKKAAGKTVGAKKLPRPKLRSGSGPRKAKPGKTKPRAVRSFTAEKEQNLKTLCALVRDYAPFRYRGIHPKRGRCACGGLAIRRLVFSGRHGKQLLLHPACAESLLLPRPSKTSPPLTQHGLVGREG